MVLNCILPNLAGDHGFVTMFLDEARIAATLRHSNIADVFDVGIEDGTYFFAMEYIHGQNARVVRIESKARQRRRRSVTRMRAATQTAHSTSCIATCRQAT